MNRSLRLGRIAGAEIRVHWSMALILPLLIYQDRPASIGDALWSLALQVILFLSVLIHELAHTLMARRYGIPVEQIMLWPLGGFAKLSRQPDQPRQMLLIAAVGPLANIVLALALGIVLVCWLVLALIITPNRISLASTLLTMPMWLLFAVVMNIVLAILNLLPIFPLDGGQMLRAALQMAGAKRQANAITAGISFPLLFGLALVAFVLRDWLLTVSLVLLFLGSSLLSRRLSKLISIGYYAVTDRGSYYLMRGDYDQAIMTFTRVLQQRPDWALGYSHRGYVYVKLGDAATAWADFNQACKARPDFALAIMNRGFMAFVQGDRAQALADYDRAIKLMPQAAPFYSNRATLLLANGEHERAMADMDRAIELEPNNALIYVERSRLLYLCGETARALADGNMAMRLAPRDAAIMDEVCLGAKVAGQLAWALAFYNQAIQRLPNFAPGYRGRGDAYRVNGQPDLAIVDYTRAIQLAPHDAENYIVRGRVYLSRTMFEQAAADFRQALRVGTKAHLRRQAGDLLREAERAISQPAMPAPWMAAQSDL